MKNVTMSMDEDLAAWARVEAAKSGRSLSRYLADLLADRRAGAERRDLDTQDAALERFLSGPGFPGAAAAWTSREEFYADREDELLRRHQHPDLRGRSQRD